MDCAANVRRDILFPSHQTGDAMQRRHFIRAAASSALLAAGVVPGAAPRTTTRDYFFFDDRFANARRAAASRDAAHVRVAVQGDITQLWIHELEPLTRGGPLSLRGVTTESFLFCLRILSGEHADLDVRAARIDRNLIEWTVRTTPKPTLGPRYG
jgi:hypothetical protein